MAPPPVTIYVTSLTSAPKVRKHIQLLHHALRGLEIPYESFDLATDEDAKRRWQRAKPTGMVVGLPGYLVGGEFLGTMDDFEEAVETATLESFLKQDTDHGADASLTIGEAELDRLMREMTDADLDQLVGDLSVDDVPPPVAPLGKKEAGSSPLKAAPVAAAVPEKVAEPVVEKAAEPVVEKEVKAAEPVAVASPVKIEAVATPAAAPATEKAVEHADSPAPTSSKSPSVLESAAAAVTSAASTLTAAPAAAVEKAKELVAEPAGVTAAKAEVEEEEIKEGKTGEEVVEDEAAKKDVTLDEVIDKTLAVEAVDAEKEQKEE